MSLRAVLFDMDGTLVDSEALHHRALLEVLELEDIVLPDHFGHATTGKAMPDVYALLRATTSLRMNYASLVAAKNAIFLCHSSKLKLRTGAGAAVDLMLGSGMSVAVVSNSDRMLVDASLAVTGLARPDMISVTRNDVRNGKPDPESYLRAAWLLGLTPRECLVVEDSVPGAAAGLAAGMTVVAWPEADRSDVIFPEGTQLLSTSDLSEHLLGVLKKAPLAAF